MKSTPNVNDLPVTKCECDCDAIKRIDKLELELKELRKQLSALLYDDWK